MAVVKEYITERGTTICFCDDAYRDKTPSEQQKIRENTNRVASLCLSVALQSRIKVKEA